MSAYADSKTGRSLMFFVTDKGQVGEVRRCALNVAKNLDFEETQAGRVGIVATEMASNLAKHATSGEIIIRNLRYKDKQGIEILAVDKGPGISNIGRCLEDGYSTAGSPGTGLGAISRLSDHFDVYSQVDKGSILMAQVWAKPDGTQAPPQVAGTVCLPLPGEKRSGDGWAMEEADGNTAIIMCDGLGHGENAAEATSVAIRHFDDVFTLSPLEMLRSTHLAMRGTRGAAMAFLVINPEKRMARFAGVGNISGAIYDGLKQRGLASYNGIVGHQIHKMQEMQYEWPLSGLLILHSDGLQSKWKLEDYPGLRQCHPAIIAAVLYRDYQRGRDDVTVFVMKNEAKENIPT